MTRISLFLRLSDPKFQTLMGPTQINQIAGKILLMEEILHQLIGSLSHCLQGLSLGKYPILYDGFQHHVRWLGMGFLVAISNMTDKTCPLDLKKLVGQKVTPFPNFKGQLDVPLTVYPWYFLCSLGILGDCNP